jgi:uronate dehydrogenase
MKQKVLITGAAGRIGSYLAAQLADRYDFVLTDVKGPAETYGFPFTEADITDFEAMRQLCQGVETVVHLAADPSTRASWESLLPKNIIGVYNIFEAAYQAGCRRVVFASSINAVIGYPAETQVKTSMPVRPGNLYGATKAWGEAVACFYAEQKGLSAICLRFGAVQPRDSQWINLENGLIDMILTYEDLARLVIASIGAPADLNFGIFHGVSNNRWKRLDISDARELLGYEPVDDAFAVVAERQRRKE